MNSKNESAVNFRNHQLTNPATTSARCGSFSGGNGRPLETKFAEAAYFHAGQHGFVPEDALADWFQGEPDVKALPRRDQ